MNILVVYKEIPQFWSPPGRGVSCDQDMWFFARYDKVDLEARTHGQSFDKVFTTLNITDDPELYSIIVTHTKNMDDIVRLY